MIAGDSRWRLPAAGRRPGGRAFSLAELVMVMVILALLAAIAVPRVSNTLRRQRLDMASRRLMADLQLVRAQAIHDGADRVLALSIAGRCYSLPAEVHGGTGGVVQFDAPPYEDVRLLNSSYSPAQVVFNRLGLPQAGGTITLQGGPDKAIITISASTGRTSRVFGS